MKKNLQILLLLFSMLGLSLAGFFFFRWWLNRDLRHVMVAYLRAYGTSTALADDEESQHNNLNASPKKGNESLQKGSESPQKGRTKSKAWEPVQNGAIGGGKGKQKKNGSEGKKAGSREVFEMSGANGAGNAKGKKDKNGRVKDWVEASPAKARSAKTASANGAKDVSGAPSSPALMGKFGEPQWYKGGK
jgi:hypothetical protein